MTIVLTGTDRTIVLEDGWRWPAGLPNVDLWLECEACNNMIGVKEEEAFDAEDADLIAVAEERGWFLLPEITEGGYFNGFYETILCPDCVRKQTDEQQ